jgi:hypothetical protein
LRVAMRDAGAGIMRSKLRSIFFIASRMSLTVSAPADPLKGPGAPDFGRTAFFVVLQKLVRLKLVELETYRGPS